MVKNEVKWGAILSYVLIIINALYGFLITPYILSKLGEAEYGVYKTISSFTASLMVLDLGLGGTVMRYIARFRADKEEEKIPNYIAMSLIQAAVISGAIMLVAGGLYFTLDSVFGNGLTATELIRGKELYVVLCVSMIFHVFENVINGIIGGFNRFKFSNGLKILRILLRIVLILTVLPIFKSSLLLVFIDLALVVALIIVELLYVAVKLKVKIKFSHWDKPLFWDSFKYTMLLFLTSIVSQVNGNLDNVVIGAMVSSTAVTVYSMALLIFAMFEQLSTSVSSVMLPTVTDTLKVDDENCTKTQSIIVQAGRIQFMLLGAIAVGFSIVGRDFVRLWLGSGFEDVYLITLILMIPSLLELCVNVTLSVLRAQNKLAFRTGVIVASTVLNLLITLVGTYYFGYFAAAIGTGVSFFIGSVIVMNVYYRKELGFDMLSIYKKIFSGTWICLLLAAIASLAVVLLLKTALLKVLIGASVFLVVYGVTLCLFGLKREEKQELYKFIRRRNSND